MQEKELTIEEIHEGSLVILKKIIEICEKIQVNYFLAYGSLIGAVRHKGFIPWDDDLDLIMLRPDYDKFCQYCIQNAEGLYPFKLLNRTVDPAYPFGISRFCDLRFRLENDKVADAGMGMFVDLYPFDGLGNDKKKTQKVIGRKKKMLIDGLYSVLEKDYYKPSNKGILRRIAKRCFHEYACLRGKDYFLDKLDALKHVYPLDDSKYVGSAAWDAKLVIHDKFHFTSYEYLEFEGIKVKVPFQYKQVLKNSYGDYMKLPPVEQRAPTHEYRLYRKENKV